jgi:ABC-type uncharacterized transport system auxiliary subunit
MVLLACLVVFAPGCTLKNREAVIYHALDYRSPEKESKATVPETLMMYQFLLDDSVDNDWLVVPDAPGGEESAQRHRWHENPADMITELIMRDIENSGLFVRTIDQSSSSHYRYALEGTVKKFRGTISGGKATALLEVEATLTDFDPPPGKSKTLLSRVYRIEVPSKEKVAEALVKALNEAAKQLSERIRGDIKEVLTSSQPENQKKRKAS